MAALSAALVDPSLFTAPYDAALAAGLAQAGVRVRWATRGLRTGEEDLLGAAHSEPMFYRLTDGPARRDGSAWRLLKGVEHALGLRRLVGLGTAGAVDIVHFQWAVLPRLDLWAIERLRRRVPVVLTVHDTTPFNGKAVARAQTSGFAAVLRSVDGVVVHTEDGATRLAAMGVAVDRIATIPHGLLPAPQATVPATGRRWHIVQFGKIQAYKGVEVLVEALGHMSAAERARIAVTIAGEPLIDMRALRARATALGLDDDVAWRLFRHDTTAMNDLLATADTFVFPYRAIEASGVLYQVASLGRWVVASDLGAFRELVGASDDAGTLVAPGDAAALAHALVGAIGRRPVRSLAASVPDWATIGAMTRDAYDRARSGWAGRVAA